MRQSSRDLDLPREANATALAADLTPQRLHRDLSSVLRILGEIDRRHAASPDLANDLIAAAEQSGDRRTLLGEQRRIRDRRRRLEDARAEIARGEERLQL